MNELYHSVYVFVVLCILFTHVLHHCHQQFVFHLMIEHDVGLHWGISSLDRGQMTAATFILVDRTDKCQR
jgi:hypothetical protein